MPSPHYSDVTWTSRRLKSPATPLIIQLSVQAHIKGKIKTLHHWPLRGNPPVAGGFPSQRVSNAENVSISICHHENVYKVFLILMYVPTMSCEAWNGSCTIMAISLSDNILISISTVCNYSPYIILYFLHDPPWIWAWRKPTSSQISFLWVIIMTPCDVIC